MLRVEHCRYLAMSGACDGGIGRELEIELK